MGLLIAFADIRQRFQVHENLVHFCCSPGSGKQLTFWHDRRNIWLLRNLIPRFHIETLKALSAFVSDLECVFLSLVLTGFSIRKTTIQ